MSRHLMNSPIKIFAIATVCESVFDFWRTPFYRYFLRSGPWAWWAKLAYQVMLTIRGRLITPFVLGSMSVGLNILIRHSFMDLWFWITALVPWPQLLATMDTCRVNTKAYNPVRARACVCVYVRACVRACVPGGPFRKIQTWLSLLYLP